MDPFASILLFFSALKNKLFRPKSSMPLDDHSFRQTNFFSKNQNYIFVNVVDKDQYWMTSLENLPEKAIKALRESFNDESKPSDNPTIRLIKSDFQKQLIDYERFYESDSELVNKILPYLRPDYASILKLASYVKSKYDTGERAEADRLKDHIGAQYGKSGRKLCNLFTTGYIPGAVSSYMASYVEQAIPSRVDRSEICAALNNLISKIIDFSENIYFIHRGSEAAVIGTQIVNAMKSKKPYIALHSAGSMNISIAEEIIKHIGKDNIESLGYETTQGSDDRIPSVVPFFDVRITPK